MLQKAASDPLLPSLTPFWEAAWSHRGQGSREVDGWGEILQQKGWPVLLLGHRPGLPRGDGSAVECLVVPGNVFVFVVVMWDWLFVVGCWCLPFFFLSFGRGGGPTSFVCFFLWMHVLTFAYLGTSSEDVSCECGQERGEVCCDELIKQVVLPSSKMLPLRSKVLLVFVELHVVRGVILEA